MLEVPLLGWGWSGPVVWWNPVGGFRHAFSREIRPRPEQRRDTLCGQHQVSVRRGVHARTGAS
ncbi:hypothetical protein SAMN04487819_10491 [Actinopolyspora alba]|uniref:Uncharacterized protein n=1 Tax=Actinopolyspora alba TaxID=673379 RepID=A0A1I1VQB7_9ACTN|nr:hypothetical protein [Actinopolyspora alba]SFD85186.1 hypothetical protein SAMN04487819_10491 [Actinopolyspora alba]